MHMQMGAHIINKEKEQVGFRVFAYEKSGVELLLQTGNGKMTIPMQEESPHIYFTEIEGLGTNILYKYVLAGESGYPDPYSHYQPFGVHGFSQLIDHTSFYWNDGNWHGFEQERLIFYEVHTGTFSQRGTFDGITEQLDYLLELGITALELMPVVQTPGRWNWGYDGTNLFSVNCNYGSPDALKNLVNLCHRKGIAVFLDVVYNHFGPEGNYLPAYGPYFTAKHHTPWGAAVNYDDRYCRYMRKMVLDNVRFWLETYHFDGLRLDAVHTIQDESRPHILAEIGRVAAETRIETGRNIIIVAETDENDIKIITPPQHGGYGMDAQWMDDLHHCIHTILTGEQEGYYMDYGQLSDLKKVYKNYLYTGEYSPFWQKRRGTDGSANPGRQFVVAMQNHDQVGNRAGGERLNRLVKTPFIKAAAGLIFFSPYLPLLFMGEEYGEPQPFLFFTDYTDPELKKAVSRGRRAEFKAFAWADFPDPQDEQTFYKSRLTPRANWKNNNSRLFSFYKDLITLKKTHPALQSPDKEKTEIKVDKRLGLVEVKRWGGGRKLTAIFNLGPKNVNLPPGQGRQIMNSEWIQYGGSVTGETLHLARGSMLVLERPAT